MTTTTETATRPEGINCWGCSKTARNVLPHPSQTPADVTPEGYAEAMTRWVHSHFCTQACADRFDKHIRDTTRARCIAAGIAVPDDL